MLTDFMRLMVPRDGRETIVPSENKDHRSISPHPGSDIEVSSLFRRAQDRLVHELIERIHAQPPIFFEDVVIDVLLAAGYGARRRDLARRLGRSGDGGVDGLIAQDELGLDLIYIQAKRMKPGNVVPVSDIRDFAGSLEAHRASKGTFVTTSHFSSAATDFCSQISRRVVLIDGKRLAELMIRYNIGVTVVESYQIKRVSTDYFAPGPLSRTRAIISASSQPRR